MTSIRVENGDIFEVFGNVEQDLNRTEQWRNFMRLKGGNMDIGKLTMHQVDLIMVDTSADQWFDLDLDHYANQLVYGYTRMTPQAGLQIFMPDVDAIPHTIQSQKISHSPNTAIDVDPFVTGKRENPELGSGQRKAKALSSAGSSSRLYGY
ncbi:MAG: hypothetical protein M3Y57_08665 [Acidobacteriota bacterium]|nr:hypothetical protein [Acidobacteriota bacterium]